MTNRRPVTLDITWDEWIRPNANPIFVEAAREAQTRLQNWSYAELVNHSRRLTSSSEGSSMGSGGSRVEDNEGILEHVEHGSPHIEMWRLLVGDYSGSRVFAVWSVTQPGERDFWLYFLDVHPAPGPLDTPPGERGTDLADPTAQEALQRLLAAVAEQHQGLQGGFGGFRGLGGLGAFGGPQGAPEGPAGGPAEGAEGASGGAEVPSDVHNTPVGPLFQPSEGLPVPPGGPLDDPSGGPSEGGPETGPAGSQPSAVQRSQQRTSAGDTVQTDPAQGSGQ